MNDKLRNIFIGDVHGCNYELQELLSKIGYNQKTDRVILLGDLCSRGPSPIEVLQTIQELKLEAICGNHDLKIQNYVRSGRPEKHPLFYDQLSDEHKQIILKLPAFIELNN